MSLRRFGLLLLAILAGTLVMAQSIPNLPPAASVSPADLIAVDQSVPRTVSANGRKTRSAAISQIVGVTSGTPAAYGAKCDNVTDDTIALQSAINAIQSSTGASPRALVLPPSNCRITSTLLITAPIAIVGTKYFSGIRLDTASSGVDIFDVGFQASSTSNIVLQDFTLTRAQADATGIAINAQNIGASTFSGLYVFGNNKVGNGIQINQFQNVGLHDIWVQNVTGYCFQISGATSTDGSVAGPIDTLGTIAGGSSYTNGTYFNVSLTGGSGSNALATIVVSGGAVTSVLLNPGVNVINYLTGDTLSAAAANIGGTGSGFSVPVASVGIPTNDFRLDNLSRCDGGTDGLIVGDWVSGIYVEGNIFFHQSNSSFRQSSANLWRILSSYHWVGNDIDSTPHAMLWQFGYDVHITGNRFGFSTTDVMNFLSALDVSISGNEVLGTGATQVINLGDGGGINFGKNVAISGNMISGGHFGVAMNSGAVNVSVVGNTFTGQTSYNIAAAACNYSRITIGPNVFDASQANGPIQYNCLGGINTIGNAGPKLLGQQRAANFNSTADQRIPISQTAAFQITAITVTNCSVSMTTAAGGFYPAASKAGTAIVAAGQGYAAATSASAIVSPTIAATPLATRYTITDVYLSLTTPQGAPATCDVYVLGYDLT
jgi:hypothetical protein